MYKYLFIKKLTALLLAFLFILVPISQALAQVVAGDASAISVSDSPTAEALVLDSAPAESTPTEQAPVDQVQPSPTPLEEQPTDTITSDPTVSLEQNNGREII